METQLETTVRDKFFAPAEDALSKSSHVRSCSAFSDVEHLHAGVGRVVEQVQSGRDWVQRLVSFLGKVVSVACFFQSLKSKRRLRLLEDINHSLARKCQDIDGDPFAEHKELAGFAVYAADGHYQACSTHEDKIAGKRRAVGHFFAMDLRTQALRHLDIARPDLLKRRKAEHDIKALKRLDPEVLRMGEPKGRKVILVYDRAIIDFDQWFRWKKGKGIYVVTREKENMKLQILGTPKVDRSDPRNAGVVADQNVGHSKGRLIRRIIYIDPVSGEEYRFLTNEMTLPPGLIVFMYKRRWDIEKVFDEQKNKLGEKKAWAKGPTAKCQQAMFQCIAHNLLLLCEHELGKEGVVDRIAENRRQKRIQNDAEKAAEHGRNLSPMIAKVGKRVQRSLQFIRWLRMHVAARTSWVPAVRDLRPLMDAYLV